MIVKTLVTAVIGIAALMATASIRAAEIKVLASNGVREALLELVPVFETKTGNKVVITFGLAAALKRQIEAGEAFDLAILTSAGIDDLAKQGKVDAGARASIARSGVGIGIRRPWSPPRARKSASSSPEGKSSSASSSSTN
jgi:molybdate transport system substrate-binding protein